jgi:hypothetical protein
MKMNDLTLVSLVIVIAILAYLVVSMQGATTDSTDGTVIDTQEKAEQEIDAVVSDLSGVSEGLRGIEKDLS